MYIMKNPSNKMKVLMPPTGYIEHEWWNGLMLFVLNTNYVDMCSIKSFFRETIMM